MTETKRTGLLIYYVGKVDWEGTVEDRAPDPILGCHSRAN